MNWCGLHALPPLQVLGFTFLALQDRCHLSVCFLSPRFWWYLWFGVAFFPLFLSLWVSIFFIHPVLSLWDLREDQRWMYVFNLTCLTGTPDDWLCSLLQWAVAKRLPRRVGGREEENREEANYFSFVPSEMSRYTEMVLGTKFCFLVTCCISLWWRHSWEALMGTITQLGGVVFPVMVKRSGIMVCWMFNFVSEVRSREDALWFIHGSSLS